LCCQFIAANTNIVAIIILLQNYLLYSHYFSSAFFILGSWINPPFFRECLALGPAGKPIFVFPQKQIIMSTNFKIGDVVKLITPFDSYEKAVIVGFLNTNKHLTIEPTEWVLLSSRDHPFATHQLTVHASMLKASSHTGGIKITNTDLND
jgi:hypothetical protein